MAHAGIVKRPRGTSSVMVRLITLVSVFLGGAVLYANVVRAHTAPQYQGQCMLQQAVPTTRREVMQMTTTQPAVMMTSAPAPSLQAARMGSVKALTSVSSCMGRIWMEQRLSSAACTGPKWRHCFHMQADAHILEKCPGCKETLPTVIGSGFESRLSVTSAMNAWQIGAIGLQLMPRATDQQDSAASEGARLMLPQISTSGEAPWRACSLRAQAFQRPGMPLIGNKACKPRHPQIGSRFSNRCCFSGPSSVFRRQGIVEVIWQGIRCLLGQPLGCTWQLPLRDAVQQHTAGALTTLLFNPCRVPRHTPTSCRKPGSHKTSTSGHSGPKSGGSSLGASIVGFSLFQTAVGVRVPSIAAMGGEPGSLLGPGKQYGTAPGSGLSHGSKFKLTFAAKRAYRRARNRAMTSLEGGTFYRGKWHTRASLQSFNTV